MKESLSAAMCIAWLSAITFILISGCGDGKESFFDTRDAQQIEGIWKRSHGANTTFYFSNGVCEMDTYVGFDDVLHDEFIYHVKQDSVFFPLRKSVTGNWIDWGDKWRVGFAGPDTCTVFSGGLKIGLNRM